MRRLGIALLLPALLLLPATTQAGTDIPYEELPQAVQATVQRETKGGEIVDIERERENGRIVYEIEFIQEGVKYEIKVAPDGRLLERKKD